MLRLLKIEWNKIYYYKTARIFTILYFVMLVITGVFLAYFEIDLNGIGFNFAKLGMFDFPIVWQNVTWFSAISKIFIAVIIVTNITNEYSNRTLKQNLIDGLSKTEFLCSKLLTNLLLATFSTLIVFAIALILGFVFSTDNENIFKGVGFVLAYFVKLILFFTICTCLSILFRKSAFALLSVIVLQVFEAVIWIIEIIIRKLILLENFQKVDHFYSNYLPLSTSYNLINFSEFEPYRLIQGGAPFLYSSIEWKYVVLAIFYIGIFVFFSYRLLKKRDL